MKPRHAIVAVSIIVSLPTFAEEKTSPVPVATAVAAPSAKVDEKRLVFPPFIQNLPEPAITLPPSLVGRFRARLLQSDSGQVLFFESDVELPMPEHKHGAQWGMVIDGKIDITVGDQTTVYGRGDTYYIPAGAPHRARLHPGLRAVEFFEDRDRYRARSADK